MSRSDSVSESKSSLPRHTQRNSLRSALGRRRLGKADKAKLTRRMQDELDGKRTPYYTSIALKSTSGRIKDTNREEESADSEATNWQMASDDLYLIRCKPNGPERDAVRESVIRKLQNTLLEELEEARVEIHQYSRPGKRFHIDTFEAVKHHHRRNIAGYHQIIELLKQGEDALKTAMLDDVLIFEGHSINRLEFRILYGCWGDVAVLAPERPHHNSLSTSTLVPHNDYQSHPGFASMDRVTRSLRVFSPYIFPDHLSAVVSVCHGFDLPSAMRRAGREAELVKDNDEAVPNADLSEDHFLSDSPSSAPDMTPPASTSFVLNTVRYVIDMCRSSDDASDYDTETYPESGAAHTSPRLPTSVLTADSDAADTSAPLDDSPPSRTIPSPPNTAFASPLPDATPDAMHDSNSTEPSRPPRTGRNKRTTTRQKRKRDGVWEIREKAQRHPSTREPLAFPERLVNKYGDVSVKQTVKMNWFSVSGLLHAVGAFIGLRALNVAQIAGWTADQLLESQGFVLIKWDGRKSFALVDGVGHIIARCIGFPPDPNWTSYCEGACAAMDKALREMGAPQRDPNGRRGWFWTIFTGFSMGGGQPYPMPMDMKSQKNANVVQELCANPNVRKIAHHGSSAYAFTSPKAFSFLDAVLLAVEKRIEALHLPSLFRPFPFSIFPAVTFNLGTNVWTRLHRDYNNIIFGMCAIHALGNYDYTKGGHLVLWDWKVIIEFPPGTTILIPSSAVAHGNTPLNNPGKETRKSFTQYIPGGLVRWWRYGFRTEDELKAHSYAAWLKMRREAESRWTEACSMFSKVDDLHTDVVDNLIMIPEDDIEIDDMLAEDEECVALDEAP